MALTLLMQDWSERVAIWAATGGYSGHFGVVPATIGSLVGIVLYWPLATRPAAIRLVCIGTLLLVGVWASGRVEEVWQKKDPKPVVIDEIVGMWIALLFVPYDLAYFAGTFVVFRLFDVIKPFPAGQAERLPGGWGIMLDDVIAGLYAGLAVACARLVEVSLRIQP